MAARLGSGKERHKERAKVKLLTPELSKRFSDLIAPLAKELAGTKEAWQMLEVDDVKRLLAVAIGEDEAGKYELAENDDFVKLVCLCTLLVLDIMIHLPLL